MFKKTCAAAALSLLTACPGEPTQTVATQPVPNKTTVKVDGASGIDLTPVPAPKSLLLVFRASRPKDTLDAIQKLGKLSVSIEKLLADSTDGASSHLDLKESFDLAVALDPATNDFGNPRFFIAFSLPVQKGKYEGLLDIIEREGDEVRKVGPGHFRIRSKDLNCELLAPETATSRLVCGDGTAAYRELGPWLFRTLATQPKGNADMALRVELAPLRDELVPLLRSEIDGELGAVRRALQSLGVNDAELLEAPAKAAKELTTFLEELDRVEATARLDASKPEAQLRGEVFFRSNQAWATKVLTSANGPAAPAPEAFWRLPKDADTALFGHAGDASLFTTVRRVAKKGLATGLQFLQLDKADNDAIVALIDAMPTTKGTWTFAWGSVTPGKVNAPAKPEAFQPQHAVAEMKNRVRSAAGWLVVGDEGDGAQMASFLKQSADVFGRGVKIAKKKADDEVKSAIGEGKKWAQERRKRLDTNMPKVKFTSNPPGLPKGSAALDVELSFGSRSVWSETHPITDFDARPQHPATESRGTIPIRFLVVPDGNGRYVWGMSGDAALLKQKILATFKGASADGQLSSRTDLARLKTPLRSGGFAALGRTVRTLAKIDENDRDAKKLLGLLDSMPNKGLGPVFFQAGGASGATPSLSLEVALDKAWVEDISSVLNLFAGRRISKSPPPAPVTREKKP